MAWIVGAESGRRNAEAVMKRDEFEAALLREGFAADEGSMEPNARRPAHAHDYDVRALVLSGEIALGCGEALPHTYRVGDVFSMDAGLAHSESVGPEGVRYLVGRRQKG
jgi:quercetin dioxygenase-like cupin family protein